MRRGTQSRAHASGRHVDRVWHTFPLCALAVTGATAAGASSTASGIEHWTVESTNPVSAIATLIARGPLTVGGTINLETGHVQLPGGTLTLSHHQVWGTQGENPQF